MKLRDRLRAPGSTKAARAICCVGGILLALVSPGCQRGRTNEVERDNAPVPAVQPATDVARDARSPAPGSRVPRAYRAAGVTIRSDALLIEDEALTVRELLYLEREEVERLLATTADGQAREVALRRMLAAAVQEYIGAVLLAREARLNAQPGSETRAAAAAQMEIERQIAMNFGDRASRFNEHLASYGVTVEQLQALLERQIIARAYAQQRFLQSVVIRPAELVEEYEANRARYSTSATWRLQIIAAPFVRFLPAGRSLQSASDTELADARRQTEEAIDAALVALESGEAFADVARQHSKGPMASLGGDWGDIGAPLKAPLRDVSAVVFEMQAGEMRGPFETPDGWFIVRCGGHRPAETQPFVEVQDELRSEMSRRRVTELSNRFMQRLVSRSRIGELEPFIAAAVDLAQSEQWRRGTPSTPQY